MTSHDMAVQLGSVTRTTINKRAKPTRMATQLGGGGDELDVTLPFRSRCLSRRAKALSPGKEQSFQHVLGQDPGWVMVPLYHTKSTINKGKINGLDYITTEDFGASRK